MIAFHESSFTRRGAFAKIGPNVDRGHFFIDTYNAAKRVIASCMVGQCEGLTVWISKHVDASAMMEELASSLELAIFKKYRVIRLGFTSDVD
jgi:hypothetical protein